MLKKVAQINERTTTGPMRKNEKRQVTLKFQITEMHSPPLFYLILLPL